MNKEIIAPKTILPYYFSWKIKNQNYNYNVCFSYELSKNIDINKLKKSIKTLVDRRPHLRANFKFKNNQIKYVVHEKLDPFINEISVQNEYEFIKKIDELIKYPHDLHNSSLLKVFFIKRGYNEDTVILFNIHHSIIDGKSLDSLILDLSKIYNNIETNTESNESHLNSFSILSKIEPNVDDPNLKFYIDLLKEISYEIEKYAYNCNDEIISSNNIIANEQYYNLKVFSENNKISIFNILFLSWCIFEAKLFNKKKLIVTYPVSIKNNNLDNGCFINVIYYPFIYEKDLNFKSLIEQFNNSFPTLKKLHHVNIIDHIDKSDSKYSRFGYSGYAKLKNLEIERQSIPAKSYPQMANAAFGMKYIEEDNKIYLLSESYSSMMPKYISNDLVNRFINFVQKLVKNPESKLSNLDVLYENEYQKIVFQLNNTYKNYTNNKSISQIFESLVSKYQNKIVAVDKYSSLTYLELNQKANQLARKLQENNIKVNDIVAILIDNRIEMLIAIFAILKIGAIYLPISHDTPKERIEFILKDSNTKKLLSIPDLFQDINFNSQYIDLSNHENYINNVNNLEVELSEKNIAYLIYTSGSTGKPKGVLVENKSVINLAEFIINQFKLSSNDNISKFSTFSFDPSVLEIFSSILSGATLYFVPEEIKIDIDQLNKFFNKNKITFSTLSTQFAEIFMQFNNNYLKNLLVGGENFRHFHKKNYNLINVYGPTETTVITSYFYIDKNYENFPIGKPIQNTHLFILNNDYNPCPYLMEGEIYIGGEGLAREYLNQYELTNKKFIQNPFQTSKEKELGINSRIYKTGDLGRLLLDGNIEILGRTDFQLKIQGYRIELGEIENHILSIPGVKNTIVIGFEDKNKRNYLCAYYVSNEKINLEIMKNYLEKILPSYMIPKLFIHIKNFPLNSNGKIDRKSLPKPNFKDLQTNNYVPPSNEKEMIISKIFSEILEIENISIYDDFFILGGNSIKAIKLTSELQIYFNVDISQIFIQRNIKNLAEKLEFYFCNEKVKY